MNPIINREKEQQELRELLQGQAPQLALLYGRRRVGKTHLLTHVWPAEQTFYWTASATTSLQNREQLVREGTKTRAACRQSQRSLQSLNRPGV